MFLCFLFILIALVSVVSAGFFSDLFGGKVTGKASTYPTTSSCTCPEDYECGSYHGSGCLYTDLCGDCNEGYTCDSATHMCISPSTWTDWLDRDDASGMGDYETLDGFTNVCESPVGVECRKITPDKSGTVFSTSKEAPQTMGVGPTIGCYCVNEQNGGSRTNTVCYDYEVRFNCGASTTTTEECTTIYESGMGSVGGYADEGYSTSETDYACCAQANSCVYAGKCHAIGQIVTATDEVYIRFHGEENRFQCELYYGKGVWRDKKYCQTCLLNYPVYCQIAGRDYCDSTDSASYCEENAGKYIITNYEDCPGVEPSTTCTDSDGDLSLDEQYYVKGELIDKTGRSHEDFCSSEFGSSNLLEMAEYTCQSDGSALQIVYDCPKGCSNGACVGGEPASESSCSANGYCTLYEGDEVSSVNVPADWVIRFIDYETVTLQAGDFKLPTLSEESPLYILYDGVSKYYKVTIQNIFYRSQVNSGGVVFHVEENLRSSCDFEGPCVIYGGGTIRYHGYFFNIEEILAGSVKLVIGSEEFLHHTGSLSEGQYHEVREELAINIIKIDYLPNTDNLGSVTFGLEEKPVIVDDPEECTTGCYLEGSCYAIGYRKGLTYCNQNKDFVQQKGGALFCLDNSECLSNVCMGGKCIEEGVWKKFMFWLNKFFGGGTSEECTDSDLGKEYSIKSFATDSDSEINDGCIDSNGDNDGWLREAICDGDSATWIDYDCASEEKICYKGACVGCVDSDGDLSLEEQYYVSGFTKLEPEINEETDADADSCAVPRYSTLYEIDSEGTHYWNQVASCDNPVEQVDAVVGDCAITGHNHQDSCSGKDCIVVEQFCTNDDLVYGIFKSENHFCPNGCDDGACISSTTTTCTDSDGKDFDNKGESTNVYFNDELQKEWTDICESDFLISRGEELFDNAYNNVLEGYCDGKEGVITAYGCDSVGKVCLDGACI